MLNSFATDLAGGGRHFEDLPLPPPHKSWVNYTTKILNMINY